MLITNADKNNVTIVLDKDSYISKVEGILSDVDTYSIISRDPTKKLTQDLRMLLIRWKAVGFIDKLTYKRLMTSDGNIPRTYGLIKIHKIGKRKIGNSIESHCIIYKQSLVLFFSFFTQHNY